MPDESTLPKRTLLVIGSNPPTTSGQRTLGRAEQARLALGFDSVELENLFGIATYRTGGVSLAGMSGTGWQEARPRLAAALDTADAVLLAYGTSKPSGDAAKHHVEQVAWIEQEISNRRLPVWSVGGEPRHPSRWQRYTYRAHPGVPFFEALRASLVTQETVDDKRA
ncbi:DUF1643 domain-containing protein [Arthrobacter sp. EpRS71]|uniref:DUF1643 domain-containing protein n=1 Tax=Arthrobacter sp. EpRS71 TaxID=1743141 RepID=UPI0009E98686